MNAIKKDACIFICTSVSVLIYGIGYNSKTKYKSLVGGRPTKAYDKWHGMFQRCYSPKFQEKNPAYIGCTVSEQWHDFQDFADWFYSNDYSDKGYQLDKDLLIPNNKTYSPETCCLVPSELNLLLISRAATRGVYPQGVYLHKLSGKYKAQLSISPKRLHLGYFDCLNEAYQAYKTAKELHVKTKAIEWKDRIDPQVFAALMNWSLQL